MSQLAERKLPHLFAQRILDAKYADLDINATNPEGIPYDRDTQVIVKEIPLEVRKFILLKDALYNEYTDALNCKLLSQDKDELERRKNALSIITENIWNILEPRIPRHLHSGRPEFAFSTDWKVVWIHESRTKSLKKQSAEVIQLPVACSA